MVAYIVYFLCATGTDSILNYSQTDGSPAPALILKPLLQTDMTDK